MKVNFNRAALSDALGLLTSVVPSRTPKPVLRCVKIVATKNDVRISATDLEVGVNCILSEVQIDEPGEVVVPADKLAPVVRESIDEVIALEAAEAKCEIRCADSHFTIYGQEAELFPPVPDFDGAAQIEIALDTLQGGIEQTLFATAKESSRYAINGVLWEIKGKKLMFVATDGRRLAQAKLALDSAPDEQILKQKIIVPAKTMGLLGKLTGDGESVAVRLVDNQIVAQCGNVVVSSNLVEGNFPKYQDIIPTDYDKKLSLATDMFLSAVRRASLLTTEDSRGIKLSFTSGSLVLTGSAPEAGDAEVDMVVEYGGPAIEIGFNPAFLVDVLRVIKTPTLEIELGQPDRPGLIKSGSNFLYVLMPINLG